MNALFRSVAASAATFALGALPAVAAEFQLGNLSTAPGQTAIMPIRVLNPGTNMGAFCLFLRAPDVLERPTISSAPGQPGVTCFVDEFAGGVLRVTGFVLGGSPIAAGEIVRLGWTIPPTTPPGRYPLTLLVAAPSDSPGGPNPEARSIPFNGLIPSSGVDGSITLSQGGPRINGPFRLADGAIRLQFSGDSGSAHRVEASTNLVHWQSIGAAVPLGGGQFQFIDSDSTKFPHRFYRVAQP